MIINKRSSTSKIGSNALVGCLVSVLTHVVGKTNVSYDRLATTMVEEWSLTGEVNSRLILENKEKVTDKQCEKVDGLVLHCLQRHALFSHFNEDHCNDLKKSHRMSLSYDQIVNKINEGELKPLIEYPPLHPNSDDMEELLKKRAVVEDAIKILYRQVRRLNGVRLPEFTNDEAWLEVLRFWADVHDYSWQNSNCKITPDIAPDCYWKFDHLRRLQRNPGWGADIPKLLETSTLLKEWPENYLDFKEAVERFGRKNEEEKQSVWW